MTTRLRMLRSINSRNREAKDERMRNLAERERGGREREKKEIVSNYIVARVYTSA